MLLDGFRLFSSHFLLTSLNTEPLDARVADATIQEGLLVQSNQSLVFN